MNHTKLYIGLDGDNTRWYSHMPTRLRRCIEVVLLPRSVIMLTSRRSFPVSVAWEGPVVGQACARAHSWRAARAPSRRITSSSTSVARPPSTTTRPSTITKSTSRP